MKYQEIKLFAAIYDQYFQCLWLLSISFIVVLFGEGFRAKFFVSCYLIVLHMELSHFEYNLVH